MPPKDDGDLLFAFRSSLQARDFSEWLDRQQVPGAALFRHTVSVQPPRGKTREAILAEAARRRAHLVRRREG